MVPRRGGRRGVRRGRKAPARAGVRGRKSVVRRRQSVRQQSKGLPKRSLIQANLGGLSLTRFKATHRPNAVAAHIKKTGQPNQINITYPGLLYGPGGQQQYSSWYLNCGNDLRRIWASIQSRFVATNPGTTAEYVDDAAGNIPNASFRYVLETATSMLHMANTSGTPVNVELYDVVAKRDCPQLGLDIAGNLIPKGTGKPTPGETKFLTPDTAWLIGMANEASTASGFGVAGDTDVVNVNPVNLGATPYQSKLFKDYFKVVRKTNLSLPIGGQHKHFVDLKPNAIIDNDMMSQNSVYKGLSFFTLVVASGVPVIACPSSDITQPLRNPLGDANTSAVSVSIIQQVKYKWTWVEDSRENIYRANYINQLNSGWESTQPAMTKIYNAEVPAAMVASTGIPVCQPSECTR